MIELRNVSKRFGEATVVEGLDLSVGRGELVVLVGGSGSGKTTTLKMVNRLIEPSGGTIELDGEAITTLEPHVLRRRIGYVFQKVGLFPHLTVAENVAVTMSLMGWPEERMRQRVDELLTLVELDPKSVRDRNVAALSGGQAQRVGVARALAVKPSVMLLDEPFGALDPLTRDRLQRSFQKIRRELGLTALFVTHDMTEALLLGDRIAVMNAGRLLRIAKPAELLANPGHPYVEELIETPKRQAAVVERLRTTPTEPPS